MESIEVLSTRTRTGQEDTTELPSLVNKEKLLVGTALGFNLAVVEEARLRGEVSTEDEPLSPEVIRESREALEERIATAFKPKAHGQESSDSPPSCQMKLKLRGIEDPEEPGPTITAVCETPVCGQQKTGGKDDQGAVEHCQACQLSTIKRAKRWANSLPHTIEAIDSALKTNQELEIRLRRNRNGVLESSIAKGASISIDETNA